MRQPLNDGECVPEPTLDATPEDDRVQQRGRTSRIAVVAMVAVLVGVAATIVVYQRVDRDPDHAIDLPRLGVAEIEPEVLPDPQLQLHLDLQRQVMESQLVQPLDPASLILPGERPTLDAQWEPAPPLLVEDRDQPSPIDWRLVAFSLLGLVISLAALDECRKWRKREIGPDG